VAAARAEEWIKRNSIIHHFQEMELGSNSHKGNCFYFLCQIGVLNVQVIAAIDIGTNSTRLLVVQRTEAGWVELARKLASTRLGLSLIHI